MSKFSIRQGPCLGDCTTQFVSSSDSFTNTALSTSTTTSAATPSSKFSPTSTSTSTTPSVPSTSPHSSTTSTTSSSLPSSTPSVVALTTTTHVNAGTIAGGVVGGAVFLALVLLGILLYLRNRKRNRTPPSSEFMNSLRPGDPPVLRLDAGAGYPPAFPEKASLTHYPNAVSHPILDMKIPKEMMMMTDIPSPQSIDNVPLHPQRYSLQSPSTPKRHRLTGSVGSWMHVVSRETSPPPRNSVLLFAPRFTSEESFTESSTISLQPLRRQPD